MKINREKTIFDVLESKQAFLNKKTHRFQKPTKLAFLQRVHGFGPWSMVLVETLKFFERFVLCKIHPEKVFGDVLVSRQAFLDNINMDLKRRQNWHFSKVDSP